ncbi:MAG: hypothetical protein K0M40_01020 [Prolixibacteraceae bacterium]|nr:hypothetical protein [Prolixibacteraceae bacterium]
MKKKDKGKNAQQQKQEEIHQKNCYLKRIKAMMGIIGDESAFDLLGTKGVESLYFFRLRPVKLISAENSDLKATKQDLIAMNKVLNWMLRDSLVNIGSDKKQISLYDYFCYPETILLYWRNVDKDNCLNPEAFKNKFPVFNDFDSIRLEAYRKKEESMQLISLFFTQLGRFTIRFELEASKLDTSSYHPKAFYNNYLVYFEKPETELFEIDGHKRTIFRINIYNENKVTGITIKPEQLGINGLLKDLPLKVYIQKHALDRINERIGDHFTDLNYSEVIDMVLKHQTFPTDDGGYLFPYTYMNKRLGYLKANIFGDRLIFRTFLFLTNNGTPEGNKLAKLLGIQKADKKYLGIDNLKTFINSDIESNENLKRIFCQTGCGELFELIKIMRINPSPTIHCADFLEKYLGLKREEQLNK